MGMIVNTFMAVYILQVFLHTMLDSIFKATLLGRYDVCSQFLDEETKVQRGPKPHDWFIVQVGNLKPQVCLDGLPSLLVVRPMTICLLFVSLICLIANGINIFTLMVNVMCVCVCVCVCVCIHIYIIHI